MRAASSFVIRAESPARFARAAADSLAAIERPAGAIIFLSGALAESLPAVASAFERTPPGVPILLAGAAGVLTDRGELEGQSAGAGLVWSGGESDAFIVNEGGDPDDVGSALAGALRARTERSLATALVFADPRSFSERSLEHLRELPRLNVLGGGTRADAPLACISAGGKCTTGPMAVMVLRGPHRSIVRFSPACRLLMPLRRVSEVRGSMVLSIDGEPALEVLQTVASDLPNQPLVLVAVAPDGPPPQGGRPELSYRSLQGVDPDRGAVVLSEAVPVGTSLAFAVRDATAARADLENVARELWRETAGAAPQFAFFISCAGRGSGLYGSPDIDVRVLRTRFPNLPFAGLHSAFEIAPSSGRPAVQLYSGVIGIFTAPS
ncbi:MAG TPA: FIST C-terminal domain-containing protein [Polyangiaceae bacterium]|nr:FIST C-terminal domain-containing protein [Polyangiaceae bacterium]